MTDQELELFKGRISLVELAHSSGYVRDEVKSSAKVSVMRRESDDDKLLMTAGDCGYDIYQSCRVTSDKGSVIDFVMTREGLNLGEARKRLRAFLGIGRPQAPSFPSRPSVEPVSGLSKATDEPDRKKCEKVWALASWTPEPAYLIGRGLSVEVMNDPRFVDTFRVNSKGAVLFLHRDRIGPTGYELRGVDAKTGEKLKGFMRDGKRGLWYSNNLREAKSIIVCESAIDCLSHYQLYGWDAGYCSIGGAISMKQKDLLAGLFAKVNTRNGLIIVATDNDAAGDDYFATMKTLAQTKLKRHTPIGNDWNADLQFVRNEA